MWLKSHENLISTDYFKEDAWRAKQASWPEAYWDTRACLKYKKLHVEFYKRPLNIDTLTRALALYIALLAVMFAILCFTATSSSIAAYKIGTFVVPYIIVAAIATWVVYRLQRRKVDFYWRLYSHRLFIYEKTWPGIKKLAQEGHKNGVEETPPPLTRRDH